MARILYGVHGTAHGHAVRALTVARHFPQHEFLFISHAQGAATLRGEFPVVECPGFGTSFDSHRVALISSLSDNFQIWRRRRSLRRRVLEVIEQFQPDACLSDYEYFLPRACRHLGLPCLSLDHQHVLTCCDLEIPLAQYLSYLGTSLAVRLLFSQASHYLVTSFFRPPLKTNSRVKILPPLLRESVLARRPRDGDHVVVYQSFEPFPGFFTFLHAIERPVIFYGLNREYSEKNITFKKKSEAGFLEDLASCRYVICGGGHSVISEALYYGKPVISFPIQNAFEQFVNAFYVQRLEYGRYVTGSRPRPELIPAFEAKLDDYCANIRQGHFCGNPEIFAEVERFIQQKGTW